MCHGEIRYGFFFLVESDITNFLPSTIGIFLFFNKVKSVKSSTFLSLIESTASLFYRLIAKVLIDN